MIVTAIAGGIAGIGVAAKMGMARLKSRVTGKPMTDQEDPADDERGSAHD